MIIAGEQEISASANAKGLRYEQEKMKKKNRITTELKMVHLSIGFYLFIVWPIVIAHRPYWGVERRKCFVFLRKLVIRHLVRCVSFDFFNAFTMLHFRVVFIRSVGMAFNARVNRSNACENLNN